MQALLKLNLFAAKFIVQKLLVCHVDERIDIAQIFLLPALVCNAILVDGVANIAKLCVYVVAGEHQKLQVLVVIACLVVSLKLELTLVLLDVYAE